MKLDEYKKAMDNIKCSGSFRENMVQKLSADPPAEKRFEDTITELETNPKLSFRNIASAAAAFVVIATAAGILYNAVRNIPDNNSVTDSTTVSGTAEMTETGAGEAAVPPFINKSFDKLHITVYDKGVKGVFSPGEKEQKYLVTYLLDLPWDKNVDGFDEYEREKRISFSFDDDTCITVYYDGLCEYRSTDENNDHINNYYYFDPSDYSRGEALIKALFVSDKSDNENARDFVLSNLENASTGSWSENGGQLAHSVVFSITDDMAWLKQLVNSYEWEKTSSFDWSAPFYTINNLMIDHNGVFLYNDIAYRAIEPIEQNADAGSIIHANLSGYIHAEPLANAQFMLINMTEMFSTLKLDISYSFRYDPLTGSIDAVNENVVERSGMGSVYIDKVSGHEYMTINDYEHCYDNQQYGNTLEMVSDGDNYAFIDHYADDMPLTTYQDMDGNPAFYLKGSKFYNTPQMFYSQLRESVISKLNYLQNFPDKIEYIDCAAANDKINGHVSIKWRGDTGTTLNMNIAFDQYGIITNSEYYANLITGETDQIYSFCITNGKTMPEDELNTTEETAIEMDSPDFSMPEFTDEHLRCMRYSMSERFETNGQ